MAGDLLPEITAELTVLGETPAIAQVGLVSVDDGCLTLSNVPRLATGAIVKVRQDDRLWLGEAIDLRADGTAVIRVVHSLDHLRELSDLADRFLGKRRPVILTG